jgi:ATP-dependent exoDNAse (exonuclease V) beta subunit
LPEADSARSGLGEDSWIVIDYKTDRREKRNLAQVQLYALALQRATNFPARGLVLEV